MGSEVRPLGRVGGLLLDLLGVTRGTNAFLEGMSRTVQPVQSIAPFIGIEIAREVQVALAGGTGVIGANNMYTNTTSKTQLLYGVTILSSAVGAGIQIECRPIYRSPLTNQPFVAQLGQADFASGATESLFSGGQFWYEPLPIPPGGRVDAFISTLVGASPALDMRLLLADL